MTDQLSSDLASLRIDRDAKGGGGGAKRSAIVALLVAIAGGVAWVEYPRLRAEIYKTEVSITDVTLLSPVQSSIQVSATGYVVPQVTSKVGAHDTGRIERMLVKEGDTVKAGQLLAQLETSDQKGAVAASQSRVAVAQAKVGTAKAMLAETYVKIARESPLVEHGAESKSVLDDLIAQKMSLTQQVKAAEAEVASFEADRSMLGVALKQRAIIAPIDGVVVSKPAMAGYVTTPADQNPIVELVDFKSLLAEVDVPEARLSLIKMGAPVELVLDAYADHHLRGEVVEFGKKVDRSKATVVVKVRFTDDMTGVLPEMSVRASFLSAPITDAALRAPPKKVVAANAVIDRGGRKVVMLVDNGVAHTVPVTVGVAVGSSLELLDGPPNGAHVVSSPAADLADGSKVKEKETR